jgi:hypothetical protein
MKTDGREVVSIDSTTTWLARRRRSSQNARTNFIFSAKHRLPGNGRKLSETVPPLNVVSHERKTVHLASSDEELFDCGFIAIAHLIPQPSGDTVIT